MDDMMRGYFDGLDLSNPEPGPNRSACYKHGFLNGRDDKNHKPRATAERLREMAAEAEREDST